MKRVLIDAFGITNQASGLSNYSIQIIRQFKNFDNFHFTILCSSKLSVDHQLFKLKQNNITFQKYNVPAIGPARDLFYLMFLFMKNDYDLFHTFSSYLPFFMPIKKKIVTLHDVKYIKYPKFINNRIKYFYLRISLANSFKNSSRILAVSNFTKNELIDLNVSKSKISVVYESNTLNKNPRLLCKSKNHFLFVGVNRPHKNIKNLIMSYKLANEKVDINLPNLVIVGSDTQKLKPLLYKLNIDKLVILKGHVKDEELLKLYKNSYALIYPSLYEGFGLPILESMSLGKPVITSNITATAEISGYAGILVDPLNICDISNSIVKLYNDDIFYKKFSRLSYNRSLEFSWEKAGEKIFSIYKKTFT